MKRSVNFARFSLAVCVALPFAASAATNELFPVADARILGIPGGFEMMNFAQDILSVYTAPGNVQRTLLQFDLSGVTLPDTERVSRATLTLRASTGFGGSTGQAMEVYRVLAPWDEATLTWRVRSANVPWITPGGDFAGRGGQPFASSTERPNNGALVSWDVTELIDQWLEGVVPNHGMLLRSYDGNGLTFTQREFGGPANSPKLTVVTAPGPPRLRYSFQWESRQLVLFWRGSGTGILQEATRLGPTANWSDSALPVSVVNNRSQVTLTAAPAQRFFRLRK